MTGLAIAAHDELERRVDETITEARLRKGANPFFVAAKEVTTVEPENALAIGLQFQAMTKTFMFTTISSLGLLARSYASDPFPSRSALGVFQNAYLVIGDDLGNIAPAFSAVAPSGPGGIHYLWWEDTILSRFAAHVDEGRRAAVRALPPAVQHLIDTMQLLATHELGAAVQLRVVETIARDVAVAFRRLLPKVKVDGESLFPSSAHLAWVDAHIRAEVDHAQQVSQDDTGMTSLVTTQPAADEFVELVREYALGWSRSIEGYVAYLQPSKRNGSE